MEPALPPWGKSVSINLFSCKTSYLQNPNKITAYIQDIITHIDMKAHGPCHIERFGSGALEGWSAMQFIETSSITVHTDEVGRRCFIDIFSCKNFNTKDAARFSKDYFASTHMTQTTLVR